MATLLSNKSNGILNRVFQLFRFITGKDFRIK